MVSWVLWEPDRPLSPTMVTADTDEAAVRAWVGRSVSGCLMADRWPRIVVVAPADGKGEIARFDLRDVVAGLRSALGA